MFSSREERIRQQRDKIERGRQVTELMKNPHLRDALTYLEKSVIDAMKGLKPTDIEGRDACWRELRAVSRFKQRLEDVMRSGEAAKQTVNQLEN
jgi:hypothetical protein